MLSYRFWDIPVLAIVDKLVEWPIIVWRSRLMFRFLIEAKKTIIGEVKIWLSGQLIKIME